MGEEGEAVCLVESYGQLGIAMSFEYVACGFEGRAKGVVGVDLAVDDGVDGVVGGVEGLFPVGSEVVDREPTVGEG
jgi:hypothetical protein